MAYTILKNYANAKAPWGMKPRVGGPAYPGLSGSG